VGVRGLRPTRTTIWYDFERDAAALLQIIRVLDVVDVDKNIVAAVISLNEAIALFVYKFFDASVLHVQESRFRNLIGSASRNAIRPQRARFALGGRADVFRRLDR
jgi:hypothetical protein